MAYRRYRQGHSTMTAPTVSVERRILALAAGANHAANNYRDVIERGEAYAALIQAANKMLAATDELTTAIADAAS